MKGVDSSHIRNPALRTVSMVGWQCQATSETHVRQWDWSGKGVGHEAPESFERRFGRAASDWGDEKDAVEAQASKKGHPGCPQSCTPASTPPESWPHQCCSVTPVFLDPAAALRRHPSPARPASILCCPAHPKPIVPASSSLLAARLLPATSCAHPGLCTPATSTCTSYPFRSSESPSAAHPNQCIFCMCAREANTKKQKMP